VVVSSAVTGPDSSRELMKHIEVPCRR